MEGAPIDVSAALARVVATLPGGGEDRPGQLQMAEEVVDALTDGHHLVVQAGTGTGKSLGYLVPATLLGARCVVATATKALQEQLVTHDLPFLRQALGLDITWALLKGRSNYLCLAALDDAATSSAQTTLLEGPGLDGETLDAIVEWETNTPTGDRSDLPFAVAQSVWSALSVSAAECPGAPRCARGDDCFAEAARNRAAQADVVVVNTHLYCAHLASGGVVLPEHDVVVIDEAHALEDIAAATLGVTISPSRVIQVAKGVRSLFTGDHPSIASLEAAGRGLSALLESLAGSRVEPDQGDLAVVLNTAAEAAGSAAAAARAVEPSGEAQGRADRLVLLAESLRGDIRVVQDLADGHVAWVEDGAMASLRVAPIDVGVELSARLYPEVTTILTSATLVVGGSFDPLAQRLGLNRPPPAVAAEDGEPQPQPVPRWRGVDVGSPFDYPHAALLYCAAHLPGPRQPGYEEAMLDELEGLIRAAEGRTLALFTSRRAMEAAEQRLAGLLPWEVLVQDALPRPRLQRAFLDDEHSVLLATMGFWQGFDAPGPTCSLVVIDKLPFGRPDDPLASARRDAATKERRNAFVAVDLPRAAVLLAQGAGRLIRSADDRGVVAVLDRRLATASYRWELVQSLPPMRRTKDPDEVRRFLAELAAG